MIRRSFLQSLASLLGLASVGVTARAAGPDGPRCEVCGAGGTIRVMDYVEREDGWLASYSCPCHRHHRCAAHDRPSKVRLLDGSTVAWDRSRPLNECFPPAFGPD